MQSISNFNFNTSTIRVVTIEGNPWFVAKDVCSLLALKKHHRGGFGNHLQTLGQDERKVVRKVDIPQSEWVVLFDKQVSSLALISESAIYKLVLRSDKSEAKPFQD